MDSSIIAALIGAAVTMAQREATITALVSGEKQVKITSETSVGQSKVERYRQALGAL